MSHIQKRNIPDWDSSFLLLLLINTRACTLHCMAHLLKTPWYQAIVSDPKTQSQKVTFRIVLCLVP